MGHVNNLNYIEKPTNTDGILNTCNRLIKKDRVKWLTFLHVSGTEPAVYIFISTSMHVRNVKDLDGIERRFHSFAYAIDIASR